MCGILAKFGEPIGFEVLLDIFDEDKEAFIQRGEHSFGMLCINLKTGKYEVFKWLFWDTQPLASSILPSILES